MKLYSVFDEEFRAYGRVLSGYDVSGLLTAMAAIPLPEAGTDYAPAIPALEACAVFRDLGDRAYGGMPVQLGMCWGRNRRLNCLEYHRDSEVNVGQTDFILLLARQEEIRDGILDTEKVRAFRAPAGAAVEVYATTLHYAPCQAPGADCFRVAVVLPRGTNTEKPAVEEKDPEDRLLRARNKWLLAHKEAPEAADGAWIGLVGKNIDLETEVLE